MSDNAVPAGAEAPSLEALMEKLSDPATPAWGRQSLLDQVEAHHKATTATDAAAPLTNGEPLEGFEAPVSGLAYQFEQALPPGVEITDTTSLGALKGSLADAGVPADIGNAAFGDIARLSTTGAYESEAAYVDACGQCRAQIERVHGEGAKGLIADALSWIEDAVRANPKLEEAATFAMASPMALQAAANMKRFGRARK
ncbi:hypothetical protein [uncultured Sphingomonas sp.]|uniref:hypothetical protein n=1 Tax=uncultured Sphingomonas sp. TaxID=158754 RepID=UPI0035CAA58B